MKFWNRIVCTGLVLSGFSLANPAFAARDAASDARNLELLERSKDFAQRLLNYAAGRLGDASGVARIAQKLEQSRLHFSPSRFPELDGCSEATMAFTQAQFYGTVRFKEIHICRGLLQHSEKAIAQVLIHEAAHIAGYGTECAATEVALLVMNLSGIGSQFESDYLEECGLSQ